MKKENSENKKLNLMRTIKGYAIYELKEACDKYVRNNRFSDDWVSGDCDKILDDCEAFMIVYQGLINAEKEIEQDKIEV